MVEIKPLIKPEWLTIEHGWLSEHLDHIQETTKPGHKREITGIIRVEPDKAPGTAKEGMVYLMTKFLRLIDELDKHQVHRDRLPEVVIGQVGGGYQAQVTLTIKTDTYVSPYMAASKIGSSETPKWTWVDQSKKAA